MFNGALITPVVIIITWLIYKFMFKNKKIRRASFIEQTRNGVLAFTVLFSGNCIDFIVSVNNPPQIYLSLLEADINSN